MRYSSGDYHKRALKLIRNQQSKKALKLCADWAAEYPDEGMAWLMQGSLLSQREPARALPALKRAMALQPDNPEARLLLVECALAAREYSLAAANIDAVGGQLSVEQIERVSGCCQRLARIEQQRQWLVLLLRNNKLKPALWYNLAEAEIALGNVDAALALYRKMIEISPGAQQAHFELARLESAPDTPHLAQMESALASVPPGQDAVLLHYAIGKTCEDRGEYVRAFEHFLEGGRQARANGSYEVASDLRQIETTIAHFSAQAPVSPDAGPEGPAPIFVTGLPRSGTTLIERLLSNHPQVDTVNETFFFQVAMQECAGLAPLAIPSIDTLPRALGAPPGKVGARYLELVAHLLGGRDYFVEKLPENYLYMELIARSLPRAKLLHVTRHPLDVCLALFKQPFFRFAYTLQDLAAYYLAYRRLMDFWRERLGERLVEVSYEDFVADSSAQARILFARLGLPFDERLLDLQANRKQTNSASAVQVRQPVHNRSVGLWRAYGEQLQPLLGALVDAGILDSNGNAL